MQTVITEHGAVPDTTVNTKAIQASIDSVSADGGTVVVPPGNWPTGTIWLKSGVELHLVKGAVLQGTNDPEDYPEWSAAEAGLVIARRAAVRRMVGAADCENIAITGEGTIDGRGGCAGQIKGPWGAEGHPQNIHFAKCRHVTVSGIHIRNAGSWAQQYLACEQLNIRGISVWNHGNKTNDGMDIDGSTDVRISDCDIDTIREQPDVKLCTHRPDDT